MLWYILYGIVEWSMVVLVRGVSYRAAANPKYLGVPQLTSGRGWRASMGLDEP